MTSSSPSKVAAWPRRFALLLCGLTFPLIWVGGLITTTDAGMAVPDWPGTYGYNLFLYPWQTWFFGPWDLFIEHGHRLLASLVGLVTIGLVVAAWRSKAGSLRWLAVAALGLVIFQGVLGGLRVVANERLLALAHGVTGPLFFALTCVIVGRLRSVRVEHASLDRVGRLAFATAVVTFAQLALGGALRHMPETAGPWAFAAIVKFHLLGAAIVAGHALWLAIVALRGRGWPRGMRLAGAGIGLVLLVQLSAGFGAWWLKYGLPGWAEGFAVANMGANLAGGWWQTYVVTAHQAGGSLLLGLSAYVATRALSATGRSPERSDANEKTTNTPVNLAGVPTS